MNSSLTKCAYGEAQIAQLYTQQQQRTQQTSQWTRTVDEDQNGQVGARSRVRWLPNIGDQARLRTVRAVGSKHLQRQRHCETQ